MKIALIIIVIIVVILFVIRDVCKVMENVEQRRRHED